MGLTIIVFTEIQPVSDEIHKKIMAQSLNNRYNEALIHEARTFNIDKDYAERAGDLIGGHPYHAIEKWNFRVGSYGSHGTWRRHLAKMVGIDSIEEFWEEANSSPEAWERLLEEVPFAELLDFSDCDGVIAGPTAKRLADYFNEYSQRAEEYAKTMNTTFGDNKWFLRQYENWKKAFNDAALGGAVVFC